MFIIFCGEYGTESTQQLYDQGFQLFLFANFKIRVGLLVQYHLLISIFDIF